MTWPLLDSHCHLDAPEFDNDRVQVIAAARQAGVAGIVVPAYMASRWPALLALCGNVQQPMLWPALGLHPVYIAEHSDADLQTLESELLAHPELVAVGEIGLDRFLPELITPDMWRKQQQFFEAQLMLAQRHGKPVIIHARRCHAEIVRSVKRVGFSQGGVVHAFSGSVPEAQAYTALGLHLGLGGPLTYPQSRKLRDIATQIPLEHLLIETDAPDMVPWPQREHHCDGRAREVGERVRNSPAYLPSVFEAFCQLRPESPEALARAFWLNTQRAFNLPPEPFHRLPPA
ncbi:MAG: TatD family hydrolase [Paraperlucidibaca sp.]